MKQVTVKEAPIEQAVEVNDTVTDFGEPYSRAYFEDRYRGRKHLVIVAFLDDQPVGYIVGYDRDSDGSFYCWMAGVNPAFRRMGVLTSLMNYQVEWAKFQGYKKLKIKTRNNRREMLANLVKRGFLFTEVVAYPEPIDNRIGLEMTL